MTDRIRTTTGGLVRRVATAVILLVLVLQGRGIRQRDETLSQIRPYVVRAEVVDRLIGGLMPSVQLQSEDGAEADLALLARGLSLWILAPRECVSCLDDAAVWNAAVAREGADVALILSGVSPQEAVSLARSAGVRFPFFIDESQTVRAHLGLRLPSTFLHVDRSGVIIVADSGSEELRCRADFAIRMARAFRGSSSFTLNEGGDDS